MQIDGWPLRVLIVEDSEDDAVLLADALRQGGYSPDWTRVENEAQLRTALETQEWDIVFCDYVLPAFDAIAAIRIIRDGGRDVPIIVVSGAIGEDVAVESMRSGANDYLHKSNLRRLLPAVERNLREATARRDRQLHEAQKRQAEEALREVAERELTRIKMAVEFAADAIAVMDESGTSVYHNRAFNELLGCNAAQLNAAGGARSLFVHQQVADEAFQSIAEMGSWAGNAYLATPARKPIQLFLRANVARDAAGNVTTTTIVCTDLREQKRAQGKIEEQAALLDHAQDAIIVHDLTGRVTYWNKSSRRVFGWSVAEAVGQRVQDFLYEEVEQFDAAMTSLLRHGAWTGELAQRHKDQKEVLIEGRWALVRDEFGDPRSVLSINTDITEKKKLEAQFLRAQRMESIGTLAGGIAHDLNNVLGPIIMAVDLFKLKMTDPRDLDLLDTVAVSAQRGAEMVKQVLSFARGIEGQRAFIRPLQLLKELQRIARDTFPKSMTVQVSAAEDTWNLLGDYTQLHQVLLNLCVNARDAMPRGGRLQLSASNAQIDPQFAAMHPDAHPGLYVVLEVADTGTGIAPDVVEKIFEPFFTTKAIGTGTGLGLSTTLAITRSHGGFITVESVPGQGTKFRVHLPADLEHAGADDAERLDEFPRGHGECVLIIDDEASVRSITCQTLEAFGYRIITAADGAEGIAKYAQHSHDIAAVLTDMMMPVMDGGATIRALTRLNPAVKIIAASGLTSKAAEAEAAGEGIKTFLPKPFTASTLLMALRDLLRATD
jgi:PAS domain S-box-containing protein